MASNTVTLPATTSSIALSVNYWNEAFRALVTSFRDTIPPTSTNFTDLQSILTSGAVPTGVMYRSSNGVLYTADSSYRRTAGSNYIASPWTRNGIGNRFEGTIAGLAGNISKMESGELVSVVTSNARLYLITDASTSSFIDVGIPPLNSLNNTYFQAGSITGDKLATNLSLLGTNTSIGTGNLTVVLGNVIVNQGNLVVGTNNPGPYTANFIGNIHAYSFSGTSAGGTADSPFYGERSAGSYGWLARVKSIGISNDSGFWLEEPAGNVQLALRAFDGTLPVLFSANSAQSSFITSGYLGLGTTTPSSKLTIVNGNANVATSGYGFVFADGSFQSKAAVLKAAIVVSNTTYSAITDVIPVDDTAPLIGEGREVVRATITPSSTSDNVQINFGGAFSTSGVTTGTCTLWRGSTLLYTHFKRIDGNPGGYTPDFKYIDSPSTTSSIVYSVRIGVDSGTIYQNGSSSSRLYNGTAACTIQASIAP